MTIASEILKAQNNLKDCYDTCKAVDGVVLPDDKNFDNLSALIEQALNPFNKPSDWSDIRVDCPENSIALYAAHSADYSSYDNLGFTATCSGGYNVFIDGTQYGTTYASGAQCSITWSTSGITTGDDITTPSALKAHKIWIEPATAGNNITAFKCDRVAASGTEEQGILWAHFNLTNEINIENGFYTASTFENRILTACTAKNNKISLYSGLPYCFYYCDSLEYVPVFIASNSYRSFYGAFRYCYKLKKLTIKNLKALSVNNFFTEARSLEKLNLPNADFSKTPAMTNFLTNAANLKDTTLDARTGTLFTRLGCYGSSSYFMGGFKGLRVSNEAPFNDAISPQINVSYTGMDRAALVQLFNDLPGNIGYEVAGSPIISNGVVSGFSNSDYLRLTFNKNWKDISEMVISLNDKSASTAANFISLTSNSVFNLSANTTSIWLNVGGTTIIGSVDNNLMPNGHNYLIKYTRVNSVSSLYISQDGGSYQLVGSADISADDRTSAYINFISNDIQYDDIFEN